MRSVAYLIEALLRPVRCRLHGHRWRDLGFHATPPATYCIACGKFKRT